MPKHLRFRRCVSVSAFAPVRQAFVARRERHALPVRSTGAGFDGRCPPRFTRLLEPGSVAACTGVSPAQSGSRFEAEASLRSPPCAMPPRWCAPLLRRATTVASDGRSIERIICAPRRHPRYPRLPADPKADFPAPASWGVASVPPGLSARCGLTSCSPETQSRQGTVPSGTTRSISPEAGDVKTRQGAINPQIMHTDIHTHPLPAENAEEEKGLRAKKPDQYAGRAFGCPFFSFSRLRSPRKEGFQAA